MATSRSSHPVSEIGFQGSKLVFRAQNWFGWQTTNKSVSETNPPLHQNPAERAAKSNENKKSIFRCRNTLSQSFSNFDTIACWIAAANQSMSVFQRSGSGLGNSYQHCHFLRTWVDTKGFGDWGQQTRHRRWHWSQCHRMSQTYHERSQYANRQTSFCRWSWVSQSFWKNITLQQSETN